MSRGGYPEAVRRARLARVRQWHRDYLASIIERDARDVANLRNLGHLDRLLTLQTAQLLNIDALAKHLGIRREAVRAELPGRDDPVRRDEHVRDGGQARLRGAARRTVVEMR